MRRSVRGQCGRIVAVALLLALCARGEVFRIATFNLENYLDSAAGTRPAKSKESKAKIRESILALRPDVLAVEELGSASALLELRDSLREAGLDLEHWQLLVAGEADIHVGLLSRFPFSASRPHTNETFLLDGRRFHVSRGFAEVDIQVNPAYRFTLIAAHLKSKRASALADEAQIRLEEARLLREKIDSVLTANPNANLVVLGDFNDTKDSESTKAILGRGKTRLVDTRPAEKNGDGSHEGAEQENRTITWTHYYAKEDSYRRIDFILLSRGMAQEWLAEGTYVLALPNWGVASDHRPVVAAFEAQDK
ncbi:MAG TPA: endonuclease/exonuclease/phosphatase family protein [Verrucomicrobiae bacterium]|nr:endonuclease/exonuclease/phosphatase family protein [Verrucomicrobiae bacterium]